MTDLRIVRYVNVVGRVQGVGFRAFVEHHALKHGIEGWVRNRRDGSVEAVFAGEREAVEAIIRACEVGPLGARVNAVYPREGTDADLSARRVGELFSLLPTT